MAAAARAAPCSARMRRRISFWGAPAPAAPRLVLERAVERRELHPGADLDLLLHTIGGAVLQPIFVERKSVDARGGRAA